MDVIESIRIVLGAIFILFLPGLSWSFVFFKKEEIDWIERTALSFGLSIALVTLFVFWLNYLFRMGVNFLNVTLVVIILTIIPVVYVKYGEQRFGAIWQKQRKGA